MTLSGLFPFFHLSLFICICTWVCAAAKLTAPEESRERAEVSCALYEVGARGGGGGEEGYVQNWRQCSPSLSVPSPPPPARSHSLTLILSVRSPCSFGQWGERKSICQTSVASQAASSFCFSNRRNLVLEGQSCF